MLIPQLKKAYWIDSNGMVHVHEYYEFMDVETQNHNKPFNLMKK